MKRVFVPGRWSRYGAAVPDNQASELDNILPLGPTFPPAQHSPMFQRPPARRGRGLVAAIAAVALIAVGVLLVLAPISATTAVATWVGPR